MNDVWFEADMHREEELGGLSAWLETWDPSFRLARLPSNALIYEPEGTLYGIALGGPMSITLHHRTRIIGRGDAIVVPQALALEAEPEVDMMAVTCAGSPPDHFRERFIQVWGYDHFQSGICEEGTTVGRREVIPGTDLRYRVSYLIQSHTSASHPAPPGRISDDLILFICFFGRPTIGLSAGRSFTLSSRRVLALHPSNAYSYGGEGVIGELHLTAEISSQIRRARYQASRGHAITPESFPEPHDPSDPEGRIEIRA